jgi:hypothetical protein
VKIDPGPPHPTSLVHQRRVHSSSEYKLVQRRDNAFVELLYLKWHIEADENI